MRGATLLTVATLTAIVSLVGAPPAAAKLSGESFALTCDRGEVVESRYRLFEPKPIVLGCARLPSGTRVQVAAAKEGRMLCFYLTYRRPNGGGAPDSGVCALLQEKRKGHLRPVRFPTEKGEIVEAFALFRHGPGPTRLDGLATAAVFRAGVHYFLPDGSTERTLAGLVHVNRALAERVGAPRAFVHLTAELPPRADTCRGVSIVARGGVGQWLDRHQLRHGEVFGSQLPGSRRCPTEDAQKVGYGIAGAAGLVA